MQIWEKFNPRERMTAIGAGLVILAWLLSLTSFGIGSYTLALVGAIAVLVILYLKYTNTTITWPAPVSLIILAISVIVAILALLALLSWLSLLGFAFVFGLSIVAVILQAIGAGLMAWGAWQEYQIEKPAMPNFSGSRPAAPPPSSGPTTSAPPPSAPPASAPPPASTYA
ncbi:MAG TPA: hypothetical protein VIM39_02830, partial [Candidatus Limnocylindrales bacterium]